MSDLNKMNELYEKRATVWAERYGIVEYKIIKGHMVYNKSYPSAGCEKRYTVKHIVNLRTMTELTPRRLKRFDPRGYLNTYK